MGELLGLVVGFVLGCVFCILHSIKNADKYRDYFNKIAK